jgi:SAM-dependent methyltransferase
LLDDFLLHGTRPPDLRRMSASDAAVAARDRHLAPTLLAPFAGEMAHRLARISIGPVLETSADTGVLTQAIASALSAGMTIVATDPSAAMVAYASMKPGMVRITWQQADPAALPFPDATFGIVACHFGVVTMPDRAKAFLEARRVLKPVGRFVFSAPSHIRHNPAADCVQGVMDDLFSGDPPSFIGQVLHGYADQALIDDELTEAGFTEAVYAVVDLPYVAASASVVARGYCVGTALGTEIETRAPGCSEQVIGQVVAALERRFGTGPITTTMRAHIISAAG